MKTGMSLSEMATEITRQAQTKKDYLVPTQKLAMTVEETEEGKRVALDLGKGKDTIGSFELTEVAHDQIGAHAGIPAKYYDRMRSASPELLAVNVNHWIGQEKQTRMVRTLDGKARAFLSNRYRVIDNVTVAEAVLPIMLDRGNALGLRVESAHVSDTRLYIKAVSERIAGTVVGEAVQAGIVISNSEVGLHSFRVEQFLYILSCTNGAIRPDSAMRKYHVGKASAELETAFEVFADDTKRADDKALMLKMRDVVSASFDGDRFQEYLKNVSLTADRKIVGSAQEVVEGIVEVNGLAEGYGDGILMKLLGSGDLTQWGLSNAVTEFCQTVESYEDSTTMERIGGEILEMNSNAWKELVAA
jgi:hypothetical protein